MDSRASVSELLGEWRRQTLDETAAIRAEDWPRVRACQSAKAELEGQLLEVGEPPDQRTQAEMRQFAGELMSLEEANGEWLGRQLAHLQAQTLEIEGSSRRLKQLRSCYGSSQRPHWQSYS